MPGPTIFRREKYSAAQMSNNRSRLSHPTDSELTTNHAGPHFVCKYSKETESLRVVATVLGTAQALYFKVTEQGLQSGDGTMFYDSAHFEEANRTAKLEAEAHRQAILGDIEKPSPTPKPSTPIPRPPGVMSINAAKAFAVSAPRPEYPMEARSRHITGSGVAVLTVDVSTGVVTDASMAQSFGNPILDNAALSAFRRWRFKPGTTSKIKIPISYTMTGASY